MSDDLRSEIRSTRRMFLGASLAAGLGLPFLARGAEVAPAAPRILSVKKIWDQGRHNAFTDLIRFKDRWFCTFRESEAHVGGDGRIRIISSPDGERWESAALLEEKGIDLRDPKLCVTPDGRLMATMGGSVYGGTKTLKGRRPRVAFSADGRAWSQPERVLGEGDWLWRVTWHKGVAYGTSYHPRSSTDRGQGSIITLVSSPDGVKYQKIADWDIPGFPNETTIRVLADGRMAALVRRETEDQNGWIGTSREPFSDWKWTPAGMRLGGPNFIQLPDGRLWAGTRHHLPDGARCALARLDLEKGLDPVLDLPSGGDCSYPGLVWHEGLLWMSYYSSHEKKTSIYLAKIELD